jgi:hypothetical protein
MRRLVILGNSHVGALKQGWTRIADQYPDCAITFFGAPGAMMSDVQAEPGRLVPQTARLAQMLEFVSGGAPHLEIADHDEFIVHGCGFRLAAPPAAHLSRAVRAATVEDIFMRSRAHILASKLEQAGASRVAISPIPMRVASGTDDPLLSADYAASAALFAKVIEALDRRLIPAPEELLDQRMTTAEPFSRRSRRLGRDESHSVEDRGHMNADWGEIWLRSYLGGTLFPDTAGKAA